MQRWQVVQHELMPELRSEVGSLTPKLEKMVHTLEWVRIEEFIGSTCRGCGIPVSALLSSASMHDSLAAIPLSSLMTAQRVTNCYDLMDAAYCSTEQRAHSRALGHVPLIDHNPRGGEKIEFDPAQARRYNERTAAERTNARLKDEFGGNAIRVRGHTKVMGHLMFGVLALSADQLMRLRQ